MHEEKPYLTGRTYLFTIHKGEDLLEAIQEFCHNNQIHCGFIQAIGAVEKAAVSFYDQKKRKYNKTVLNREMEILSVNGNVSIFDDKPMVHAHITLADSENKVFGGHLIAGTKVFACEIFIQELSGTPKIRRVDKATHLPLWCHTSAR